MFEACKDGNTPFTILFNKPVYTSIIQVETVSCQGVQGNMDSKWCPMKLEILGCLWHLKEPVKFVDSFLPTFGDFGITGKAHIYFIHVTRDVYSWLFMSPVTCTHDYSCHPWRLLMIIHVNRDVYSWLFMSPVTCTHEYSCHPWRGLMNIHVTRDVYSWIFIHPWRVFMNIHVTRDVYS